VGALGVGYRGGGVSFDLGEIPCRPTGLESHRAHEKTTRCSQRPRPCREVAKTAQSRRTVTTPTDRVNTTGAWFAAAHTPPVPPRSARQSPATLAPVTPGNTTNCTLRPGCTLPRGSLPLTRPRSPLAPPGKARLRSPLWLAGHDQIAWRPGRQAFPRRRMGELGHRTPCAPPASAILT
jgi:hypothetical protein